MRSIPILMYHTIADHASKESRHVAVRPRMFSSQLARLRELGFTSLTVGELERTMRGEGGSLPERPVVLSFDDGFADFVTEALPTIERFGFTATLFVTTGFVADGADRIDTKLGRMLSWSQVLEADARGVEIGAHSHSHPQLDQLPRRALGMEISRCKTLLEDRLQREVTSFSYPFGYSNARVRQTVQESGYLGACAVSNALSQTSGDRFCLPRLTMNNDVSLEAFTNVVCGRHVPRIFFKQRMLTKGWAVARRSRALLHGTPWRD
jgi:peptidoglycan/xylan/chitin deacetylase (PgdA/CDA1 family)